MAKICILAMNSVTRDIRIIKEADTLAQAGHDVTVIGILDNNAPEPETLRLSGAKIIRRNHKRYVGVMRNIEDTLRRSLTLSVLIILTMLFAGWFLNIIPKDTPKFQILSYFGMIGLAIGIIYYITYYITWLRSIGQKLLFITFFSIIFGALIIYSPLYSWLLNSPYISAFIIGICIFLATNIWILRQRIVSFIGNKLFSKRKLNTNNQILKYQQNSKPPLRVLFYRAFAQYFIRKELYSGAVALNPDVIHCQDLGTLPAGVKAKHKTGARLVFDAHEIYEEVAQGNKQVKRYYRKMLNKYQGEVDDFITINDSIANFYKENYPKLPNAVIIKNATVAVEPFKYDGRMHDSADLPHKQKILLYQGGFASKRGLDILVKSAQFLDNDWSLVMMGWGNLEPHLRTIAKEILKKTSNNRDVSCVTFLPPASHEELAQWTAGGSVGIIPYDNIGLNHLYCTPNKLWEYPNANVPILCSPLVEMTKSIKENNIGWLLPEDLTPQNLAATINNLTDKEIEQAKKACFSYTKKDNWSVYAKRLIELYENMPNI